MIGPRQVQRFYSLVDCKSRRYSLHALFRGFSVDPGSSLIEESFATIKINNFGLWHRPDCVAAVFTGYWAGSVFHLHLLAVISILFWIHMDQRRCDKTNSSVYVYNVSLALNGDFSPLQGGRWTPVLSFLSAIGCIFWALGFLALRLRCSGSFSAGLIWILLFSYELVIH